jgi:hypothetical protein
VVLLARHLRAAVLVGLLVVEQGPLERSIRVAAVVLEE